MCCSHVVCTHMHHNAGSSRHSGLPEYLQCLLGKLDPPVMYWADDLHVWNKFNAVRTHQAAIHVSFYIVGYLVYTHSLVQDFWPIYRLFVIRTMSLPLDHSLGHSTSSDRIDGLSVSFCSGFLRVPALIAAIAFCRYTSVKLMACWSSWGSLLQNSLTSQF